MQAHRVQNSAPLLHQRPSALTDFLERDFQTAKLFRAQLRENLPHLPGMLSEGWSNEIPAARCERNDTNSAVFAALYPADQPLREKAVHGVLCVNAMPPRITEKSYRPRVSDRTMVDTRSAHPYLACSTFQKSIGVEHICFPSLFIISERSSPSRVRCAAPSGAPWTAPGRSEQPFPLRGKARR